MAQFCVLVAIPAGEGHWYKSKERLVVHQESDVCSQGFMLESSNKGEGKETFKLVVDEPTCIGAHGSTCCIAPEGGRH